MVWVAEQYCGIAPLEVMLNKCGLPPQLLDISQSVILDMMMALKA